MDYWWRLIYKLAWILLIVILPVGLACVFAPRCKSLRTLQQNKARLAEENRRTEELTRELQTRQERFVSDPLFVERVAREVGMVKSNEVVFKVSPDDSVAPVAPTNAAAAVSNQTPPAAAAPGRASRRPDSAASNARRRTR